MILLDPDKLWKIMRKNNISPQNIMDKTGVAPKTLGKWLVGEASPRPGSLKALTDALGVNADQILSEYE